VHGMEGGVQTFASGRQRSISHVGERGQFGFTLVDVTEAQITLLREWKGKTVSVRDHRGQRYVGSYYEINVDEDKSNITLYNAAIVLSFVTYEEGA